MSEKPFVLNVRDAQWMTHETFGAGCRFESRDEPFPEYGVNVSVLRPGQPNALYHRESRQEDFLVLAGECLLLVDGEERRLGPWDFVHCPAGTDHVFVGASEEPCAILMIGGRVPDQELVYPVSARGGLRLVRAPEAGAARVLGPPALGARRRLTALPSSA